MLFPSRGGVRENVVPGYESGQSGGVDHLNGRVAPIVTFHVDARLAKMDENGYENGYGGEVDAVRIKPTVSNESFG